MSLRDPKNYIQMVLVEEKPKTCVWRVETIEGKEELGFIMWKAAWRKYAFFPTTATVFEEDCLTLIAVFLDVHTHDHKKGARK